MPKNLYVLLFFMVLGPGCKDVLEVDVPYDGPQLVIHGFLQPDSSVAMMLSESRHILNLTPFKDIKDARIDFFEDKVKKGSLTYDKKGWYILGYKPRTGKNYSIEVFTEKYGKTEAEANIPITVAIADVKIFHRLVQQDTSKSVLIDVVIKDPEDEKNYYEIALLANNNDKYYRNDTLIHQQSLYAPLLLKFYGVNKTEQFLPMSLPSLMFTDYITDRSVRFFTPYWQIKDLERGEFTYKIGADTYKIVKNDSLFVFLNHVDENYYYYRKSLDLHTINKGNPFAEPLTVFSNIRNGYGIFAGFSASRYNLDLEKFPDFSEME